MRYWAFPSKVSDRLAVIQGNRNVGAAELAIEVLISKPKYSRRSFCPNHHVLKTVDLSSDPALEAIRLFAHLAIKIPIPLRSISNVPYSQWYDGFAAWDWIISDLAAAGQSLGNSRIASNTRKVE